MRRLTAVLFLVVGMWGISHAGTAGGSGAIAVLLSDDAPAYTEPLKVFTREVGKAVKVYNLKSDLNRAPQVMSEVIASRPLLVFALGAKAAAVAKVWTENEPSIPVLFAMVLNPERYGLTEGQPNVAGVDHLPAPGAFLANMMVVAPRVRRVGVVYHEGHSGDAVAAAREAAVLLGIELVTAPVEKSGEFQWEVRSLADQVDGLWVPADPVVYSRENMEWLEQRCIRDQLVCIGESRNIARLGMLLGIEADPYTIGSQAAALAKRVVVRGVEPHEIGVVPPLGTRLVLNLRTARRIGLEIDPASLSVVTETLGE